MPSSARELQSALLAASLAVASAVAEEPFVVRAGAGWIPIDAPGEIVAGSALDFSAFGLADAPAGKSGWLVSVGGHFEFEGRPGVPVRFCGGNVCQDACFPGHARADALAEYFRRLGWNAVRIHHHDGAWAGANIDSLDFFLAKCFENGIYITTDLYVSRPVPWRDIGIDRDGEAPANLFKALCAVYEPAFENWAAFARSFLEHVNPYTGRRYADEPGMPLLSMVNEGVWHMGWKTVRADPRVADAWREWLAERRCEDPAFCPAATDSPPENFWNAETSAALVLWLGELEARMFARMRDVVRGTGCRALLTNWNCDPHFAPVLRAAAAYDYIDDHFYADHPEFPERSWRLPSKCLNENPVLEGKSLPPSEQAFARMADKPFTISEWNFCAPGRYRGAGGLLAGSMAARQGWDGLWRFQYAHLGDDGNGGHGTRQRMEFFDLDGDPLALSAERAVICLFLRGDMEPLPTDGGLALCVTDESVRRDGRALSAAPPWRDRAWGTRVASCLSPDNAGGAAVIRREEAEAAEPPPSVAAHGDACPPASDLRLDRSRGAFAVITPRTCGGFAESGSIDAGALRFKIVAAKSAKENCDLSFVDNSPATPTTIWAMSLDGEPLARSARILVAHLTDAQGEGAVFDDATMRVMREWGGRPLARSGKADVELRFDYPSIFNDHKSSAPAKVNPFSVFAITPSGARRFEVPSAFDPATGALSFTASVRGEDGNAVLEYEIVRGN